MAPRPSPGEKSRDYAAGGLARPTGSTALRGSSRPRPASGSGTGTGSPSPPTLCPPISIPPGSSSPSRHLRTRGWTFPRRPAACRSGSPSSRLACRASFWAGRSQWSGRPATHPSPTSRSITDSPTRLPGGAGRTGWLGSGTGTGPTMCSRAVTTARSGGRPTRSPTGPPTPTTCGWPGTGRAGFSPSGRTNGTRTSISMPGASTAGRGRRSSA